MKTIAFVAALATAALLAGGAAAQSPKASAAKSAAVKATASTDVEPEAVQALRAMSTYLRGLNAFEVKSETSLDVVTEDGQKIQVNGVTNFQVRKPNGFVIENATDRKVRRFIYDGKTFTLYAPQLGYYAQTAAPPTIRQALDVMHDKLDLELPLEDLFIWSDADTSPVEALQSAFLVGDAVIDGADTQQYVFRQKEVDWQIWIQKGDKPLPRKLVLVSRLDDARPAYSARLTWNTTPSLSDATFAFTPNAEAKQIQFAAKAK